MAFSQVIFQQAPRANTMGQAITQGAANIGGSLVQAAQLRRQQNEKLVQISMPFIQRLVNDPEQMSQFTSHPDFGRILGAYKSVGLGSVFKFDPSTGSYNVSLPPQIPGLEEAFVQNVGKRLGFGTPEFGKEIEDIVRAKNLDPFTKSLLATQGRELGDLSTETDSERLAREKAEGQRRLAVSKRTQELIRDRDVRAQVQEELGDIQLERPFEFGGFLGLGRKSANFLRDVPESKRQKALPDLSKRRRALAKEIAERQAKLEVLGS